MKKASDDQAVAYKAQTKEDEASVDKNWLASRLPYTERSGSGRVRGFSNGNTRRTAVKKSAESLMDSCMTYTKTLIKYYKHIALAAVDVSTYLTTLRIVKNNLKKIMAEQAAQNLEEPVDKESLLFLQLLLRRYEKFLTGLVATRPHLIITSRYRRRNLALFNALARLESKKAAEKNDVFLNGQDLKEFQQTALNLITDPEGRIFWSKLGISDLGVCPWDTFFRLYQKEMGEALSVQDELVMQRLITFGGVGHVTTHDFNLFLGAFGPLASSAKNAKNMWYRPGFYAFSTHCDVYRWLVLEPVGTYVICLSLKPGYHFEVHVIDSWQIRTDTSKGYYALSFVSDTSKRSDGESRSSRSNSSRKSDDLLRKSKRRKSSNSRKDKVKEVSSHDITGGEEPASSTTSSTESTKHTTFAEDDLEHRHYGDNIGNEVFYETLTALLSAAKGTIPFISDCFSRDWFLGDISMDEVSAIMASSCVGTWLMGYDQTSKPRDSLRISYKTSVGVDHIILNYNTDGYTIVSGLQTNGNMKIKRQSLAQEKSRVRKDVDAVTLTKREEKKKGKLPKFIRENTSSGGEYLNEFLESHREILRYNYNFEHVPTLAITNQRVQFLPSFHELVGPVKLTEGILLTHEMVSAETVSGYPRKTKGAILCDCFHVRSVGDRVIFALADGCNWGDRPRAAAEKASRAMVEYMSDSFIQMEMKTSVECQQQLMRAFRVAHDKIIEGTPQDEIWTVGQTTLIGGMLLPTAGLFEEPEWMAVVVCVGDCKLLLWNETRGTFDVTFGNRANARSASDSGGRLGPYVESGHADLRNLRAYFAPCKLGDYLVVVTDGVYDNFDPELWGLQPPHLDMPFLKHTSWEDMAPEEVSEVKDYFACAKIDELFKSCSHRTPYDFTRTLVQHGMKLTHNSRSFMDEHPNDPEPSDYSKYPGKMDHITAITMCVGCVLSGEEKSKKKVAKAHHPLKRAKKQQPVVEESGFVVLKRSVKTTLQKLPLKKLPSDLLTSVLFSGPRDQNIMRMNNNNAVAWTISTIPNDTSDLSEMFTLEVASHRVVAVLSKSCKYFTMGDKKINPVQVAGDSFISYAVRNSAEVRDTHQVAEMIIDGLKASHDSLITKSATENIHEIDNVELFGGILLRVSDEISCKTGREWVFVAANLGETKAYHWDTSKQTLTNITAATTSHDVSRLGPASCSGIEPYLIDAKLASYPCVEHHGIVLLLSAGVLNNLDPFFLGQAKEDQNMSLKDKETKISTFRHNLLMRLLQESDPDNLESFAQRILAHVKEVTDARAKYVKRTGIRPGKRHKYPGYLGHCTCVAFRVGPIREGSEGEISTIPPNVVTTDDTTTTTTTTVTSVTETTTTTNDLGSNATQNSPSSLQFSPTGDETPTAIPERGESDKKIHFSLASGRQKNGPFSTVERSKPLPVRLVPGDTQ